MSSPVDRQHPLGIDRGVALGGRERGVAEQLLNRAEVAAAGQQVGGEAVAQRVRRRPIRQPELSSHRLYLALQDARAQGAATGADEEWPVGWQRVWTAGDVGVDRFGDRRQGGDKPHLLPLADDPERAPCPCRRLAAAEPQRLANLLITARVSTGVNSPTHIERKEG